MVARYLKPEVACEKLIKELQLKGISDQRVLEAFRKVPRHIFVDKALYEQAYNDNALPIGMGQTISQPYIVALMTQILGLKRDEKILEIGTGSGFQTAILAQFSKRVYTIERHRELGEKSRKLLRKLGYANIVFKIGDGSNGWPQHAPFNKIIVTAGAPIIPEGLAHQLDLDGKLLIPIGQKSLQELQLFHRKKDVIEKSKAGEVVFVPLIGQNGWNE